MNQNEGKQSMSKERRIHRVYVTRNTEYHCRAGICIAVKDRNQNLWLLTHKALAKTLTGSVRRNQSGESYPSLEHPEPGDALFFVAADYELVTSRLESIQRPTKDVVVSYP